MKKLIFTALLCVSLFGLSQNTSTQDGTITVSGVADVNSKETLYKTDVTLSLDNSYYSDNPARTIEELKTRYFSELSKIGVDTDKFKDDALAYAAMGYRKEGALLTFTTNNKDEILKVVNVRMGQVTPSYVQMKNVISDEDIEKMTKTALQDAKKNATILATAAGKTVGDIHSVSSYNLSSASYWQSSSYKPAQFSITVVYKLKE